MKFVLILVMFGMDSNDLMYAIDTGISAEECETRIIEQQALLEKTFSVNDFELWCDQDAHEE
jgi:hypothetical protein